MRHLWTFAVGLLAAGLTASAAQAQSHVCLDISKIDTTVSKDGKILKFTMKDGTVYNNHLRQQCNGLIFGGFTWVVRGGDNMVCENAQTLRVLQTGEICTLGKFDPPIKKPAPKT